MVVLLLTAAPRRRRPTNLSESVTGYNKGIIAAARRKCDCKGAAETAPHIATVHPRRLATRLCYERTSVAVQKSASFPRQPPRSTFVHPTGRGRRKPPGPRHRWRRAC